MTSRKSPKTSARRAPAKAKPKLLLGSHVSTAGGFCKALDRAESIECTAIQVFVKGNTRWAFPEPKPDDVAEWRARLKNSLVRQVIAHTIYLVNLASQNPEFYRKSVDDMVDELNRCHQLGIADLVMHPGAHGGIGMEQGIEQIARSLDIIFDATPAVKTRVLLECTAGSGTAVGSRFEEIAAIIKRIRNKKRVGVCVDTCHLFAAGYDLRTKEQYEAVWREFDRLIGLKHLRAIHLNDSKKALGSHADRHEHIGKGQLGLEAFRLLLNDPRFHGIPMVLETEKDPDMKHDRENLEVLRGLLRVKDEG